MVHRSFSVGLGGGRFRAGQAANMLHMSMKASWEAVDSTNNVVITMYMYMCIYI